MRIVRHNYPLSKSEYKDNFLTSMDSFFDSLLKNELSHYNKALGLDFFGKGSYPKVNVSKNKSGLLIEAAIPGLSRQDVNVSVEDNVLTISGKSSNDEDTSFVIRELKKSSFARSFILSEELNSEEIIAKVKDGLLSLFIPWKKQKNEDKTKVINIEIQ